MTEDQIFAKCARRLLPFIAFLYLVNYIDRVNVGFASLTMNQDVCLSPAVFGFGARLVGLGFGRAGIEPAKHWMDLFRRGTQGIIRGASIICPRYRTGTARP